MFRLAFMVEDKNLAKVLTALAGLTLNMEPPQPVVNVAVQKGKVKEAAPDGGSVTGRVKAKVRGLPAGTPFPRSQLSDMVVKEGGAATMVGYVAKQLIDEGTLTTTAKRGEYIIA